MWSHIYPTAEQMMEVMMDLIKVEVGRDSYLSAWIDNSSNQMTAC